MSNDADICNRGNFAKANIADFLDEANVFLNSNPAWYSRKKKWCPICRHCEPPSFNGFCRICGGADFEKEKERMLYNGIEVDENSKAKRCPYCENEKMAKSGNYCQVCGHFVVNTCNNHPDNCNMNVSGDSRYCSDCGSTTTFFEEGYLKSYSGKPFQGRKDDTRAVDFDKRDGPLVAGDASDSNKQVASRYALPEINLAPPHSKGTRLSNDFEGMEPEDLF